MSGNTIAQPNIDPQNCTMQSGLRKNSGKAIFGAALIAGAALTFDSCRGVDDISSQEVSTTALGQNTVISTVGEIACGDLDYAVDPAKKASLKGYMPSLVNVEADGTTTFATEAERLDKLKEAVSCSDFNIALLKALLVDPASNISDIDQEGILARFKANLEEINLNPDVRKKSLDNVLALLPFTFNADKPSEQLVSSSLTARNILPMIGNDGSIIGAKVVDKKMRDLVAGIGFGYNYDNITDLSLSEMLKQNARRLMLLPNGTIVYTGTELSDGKVLFDKDARIKSQIDPTKTDSTLPISGIVSEDGTPVSVKPGQKAKKQQPANIQHNGRVTIATKNTDSNNGSGNEGTRKTETQKQNTQKQKTQKAIGKSAVNAGTISKSTGSNGSSNTNGTSEGGSQATGQGEGTGSGTTNIGEGNGNGGGTTPNVGTNAPEITTPSATNPPATEVEKPKVTVTIPATAVPPTEAPKVTVVVTVPQTKATLPPATPPETVATIPPTEAPKTQPECDPDKNRNC